MKAFCLLSQHLFTVLSEQTYVASCYVCLTSLLVLSVNPAHAMHIMVGWPSGLHNYR